MSIDAKVRDSHFHLNGVNYFRGHAEAVQLGDAGEKKTQGPQETHLAVRASVPRAKLAIDRATQIGLHCGRAPARRPGARAGQARMLAARHRRCRQRLAGRLVHQVFVILEMKTALDFTRSTRFELSGGVKAWTVTGCSSSGSRTVVTLTPGTTFAYPLLEPQWDAPVRKNWQRIGDWEDDPWAPGLTLPAAVQP